MTPQKHKDETLRTLVDLTEAAAKYQPSVLLFEDAHWADPTTLEVLDLLIDRLLSPLCDRMVAKLLDLPRQALPRGWDSGIPAVRGWHPDDSMIEVNGVISVGGDTQPMCELAPNLQASAGSK